MENEAVATSPAVLPALFLKKQTTHSSPEPRRHYHRKMDGLFIGFYL